MFPPEPLDAASRKFHWRHHTLKKVGGVKAVKHQTRADLFQRREGRWREDLIVDACDDGSIALAFVADLVPSRIILECRPSRLAICKRLPLEYVGELIAGFPDKSRPEANATDAVPFPDGKKLVSKAG